MRLLAVGQLALIAATWPLWVSTTAYPRVPLIRLAGRGAASTEWLLLTLLLCSLVLMMVSAKQTLNRTACVVMGLATLALILLDQHRLQPWAWQFVILSFVLAAADERHGVLCWRWLVISIYFWSALSKIDVGFGATHGYFLLQGLCQSLGLSALLDAWPRKFVAQIPVLMPICELLVSFGLAIPRTRRWALVAAALMHVGLLLALGPFGHGHQAGVLIWNVFFLVQNAFLFSRVAERSLTEMCSQIGLQQEATHPARFKRVGNGLATIIIIAAILWPSVESLGYCDHWPAWAVYASRPERVTVSLHSSEISKIPPPLQSYLETEWGVDEWYRFRIDRWSLDAVYAPIYPQDRFQVGVALALCQQFNLSQVKVRIEGPANRWTGIRKEHTYTGIPSLEELARTYRFNALPAVSRSPFITEGASRNESLSM